MPPSPYPDKFLKRPKAAVSEERRIALLDELRQFFKCANGDWRSVALELAERHVPAFRPEKKRGRKRSILQFQLCFAVLTRLNEAQNTRGGASLNAICDEVANDFGVSRTSVYRTYSMRKDVLHDTLIELVAGGEPLDAISKATLQKLLPKFL
jgi:hypothetical protein